VIDERDEELLRYIVESISLIDRYTIGGEDVFLTETMIQDAVLRRLETLADATSQLSTALQQRHPEIPWRQIYGFRNVAAHGYLALVMERVWATVQEHLPALRSVVIQEVQARKRT
jgi:uncharacterized protein with HEPN domain